MVSIVIATYNGSLFIHEQLRSILEQTYKDFEVIVVDDDSQDNTVKMIREIFEENNFHTYKIIQNHSNSGPTKSFERGVMESSGEYIAFCDQDDIWYRKKLEIYSDTAKHTNADILYSPSHVLKNNRMTRSIFPRQHQYVTLFSMLYHNQARGATMMLKKEFLNKIIPFYDLYDKWIYFMGLLYGKVIALDNPLHLYRIHNANHNAGYKFRAKDNLLLKLRSSLEFYRQMLLFVNRNKNINAHFDYNDVLNALAHIITFHEDTISCLQSRNIINCLKKYLNNISGREFTTREKLIYFYYYIIKRR